MNSYSARENINLSGKLFFDIESVSLLSPLSHERLQNHRGDWQEGFSLQVFPVKLMDDLLTNSQESEFYVQQPELLSIRNQLIAFNNLLIQTILYKKISPHFSEVLLKSEPLQKYNRKNPRAAITDFTNLNKQRSEEFCRNNLDICHAVKQDIQVLVNKKLQDDKDMEEDERKLRKEVLPWFLNRIDLRIWHLFFLIYKSSPALKEEMNNYFASVLFDYLENMQVSTHLSHLFMEFVQNAEKAHFEKIALQHQVKPDEVDSFLRVPKNRELLQKIAMRKNKLLELAWMIKKENNDNEKKHPYSVTIFISNIADIDEKVRQTMTEKMNTSVKGMSISSFYQEKKDNSLGGGLGLLYNSYLEDFCKERGMKYSCNIFPQPKDEKITIRIKLVL